MNKTLGLIIFVAALFLAGASIFAVMQGSRSQDQSQTKPSTESLPRAKTLAPVNQQPASGNPDQIINDASASFNDEAAIASEGDSDASVLGESDGNVNSLMQQYNENAF